MQKIRVGLLMIGMCASAFFVKIVNGAEHTALSGNSKVYVVQKADQVYDQVNFGNEAPLSREVFRSAYTGFLNLKAAGKLNIASAIITICDFSLSSNVKRLWAINTETGKVLFHSLVAHGQGTGDEFASAFSNRENSHQSSMGFFVTDGTYNGDNGYSLKLKGMDPGYNDAAYSRAIVIHGADYVCESFIQANQRLGRSWGCPAVPRAISAQLINSIKDGNCLFIYYPDRKYFAQSSWLNKVPQLPQPDELLKQKLQRPIAIPVPVAGKQTTAASAAITEEDPNVFHGVRLAVGR